MQLHCLASRNCSFIKQKTGKENTHLGIWVNLVGLHMSVKPFGKLTLVFKKVLF